MVMSKDVNNDVNKDSPIVLKRIASIKVPPLGELISILVQGYKIRNLQGLIFFFGGGDRSIVRAS